MKIKGEIVVVDFGTRRALPVQERTLDSSTQIEHILQNPELVKKRLLSMMIDLFGVSLSVARLDILYREVEKSLQLSKLYDINIGILNEAIARIYDTMNGTIIANNNIGEQFTLQQARQYDDDEQIFSFLQDICEKRGCSMADLNTGRVLLLNTEKKYIRSLLKNHPLFKICF